MHSRSWITVLASLLLLSLAIAGVAKTPAVSNGPTPETFSFAQWRLNHINTELDEDFDLVVEDFTLNQYEDWTIEDGGTQNGGYDTWANSQVSAPESANMGFGYLMDIEGTAFMFCNSDAANAEGTMEERLISPEFSLADLDEAVLTFDSYFVTFGGDIAIVEISTVSNEGPWTEVYEYEDTQEGLQTIDLSDYLDEESLWLSFYYTDGGEWLYGWGVDNVLVLGTRIDEGIELSINQANFSSDLVWPDENIHVELELQNTGLTDAPAFTVDVFYNRDAMPVVGDESDDTWTVDGLEALSTVTLEGDITYEEVGIKNVYFIVDNNEQVEEANENNNIDGPYEIEVELLPSGNLVGQINGDQVRLDWEAVGSHPSFPGFEYSPPENFDLYNGVLTFNGSQLDDFGCAHDNDVTYDDVAIEIEVARMGGAVESSIGVYLRASGYFSDDDFSGYVFLFSSAGSFLVGRLDNGAFTPLNNGWTNSNDINTELEAVNVVTATMIGSTGRLYFNGELAFSFVDNGVTEGFAGICTFDPADDFDNQIVWQSCILDDSYEDLAGDDIANIQNANVVNDANLKYSNLPTQPSANIEFAGFLNNNHNQELDEFLWYNVYRNGEFVTNTADLFFEETLTTFGMYEYYITAGYDEGASSQSNPYILYYVNPQAYSGIITECTGDGTPLEGVAVYADGEIQCYSDANGSYSFGMREGTYDIAFELEDYITQVFEDVNITGETITNNVVLLKPVGTLSTDYVEIDIDFSGDSDSTGSFTVDLSNTGCGDLVWRAKASILETPWETDAHFGVTPLNLFTNRNHFGPSAEKAFNESNFISNPLGQTVHESMSNELDEQWDNLFGLDIRNIATDQVAVSATVVEDRIYVCAANLNGIYTLDMDGTVITQVQYPAQMTANATIRGPLDLAWDGEYFYGGNANGDVFQFSADMSTVNYIGNVGHWALGLAYDWDNGYIYTYEWASNFRRLDIATGEVLDIGANPQVGDVMGLSYMPYDSEGYTIWILSQGVDPTNDPAGRVYRYNPDTDEFDLNYVELFSGVMAGGFAITPDYRSPFMDLTTFQQGNIKRVEIWEGIAPPWLYVDEADVRGTLEPDQQHTLTIHVDFTAARLGEVVTLNDGDYSVGTVKFNGAVWNGGTPIDVVVNFHNDAVKEDQNLPGEYALYQNYPNPFNPTTEISYNLPEAQRIKLAIYNVMGQEVSVLVDGQINAGLHSVNFDASNLATGLYFYRMEAKSFTSMKKMLLVK